MAASWALRIFDAATICIALVIWAVLLMERIRRRSSRVLAMAWYSGPERLELLGGRLQLGHERIVQRFAFDDVREQGRLGRRQEFAEPALIVLDAIHRDGVDVAVLHHPQNRHLDLDRNRLV